MEGSNLCFSFVVKKNVTQLQARGLFKAEDLPGLLIQWIAIVFSGFIIGLLLNWFHTLYNKVVYIKCS
jgi:hypothetical protein